MNAGLGCKHLARFTLSFSGYQWVYQGGYGGAHWQGSVFGLPQWTASTWSCAGGGPHLNSVWQPPCHKAAIVPYDTQTPLIKHGDTNEGLLSLLSCDIDLLFKCNWWTNKCKLVVLQHIWQILAKSEFVGQFWSRCPSIKSILCECPQMLCDILCAFIQHTVNSENVQLFLWRDISPNKFSSVIIYSP